MHWQNHHMEVQTRFLLSHVPCFLPFRHIQATPAIHSSLGYYPKANRGIHKCAQTSILCAFLYALQQIYHALKHVVFSGQVSN